MNIIQESATLMVISFFLTSLVSINEGKFSQKQNFIRQMLGDEFIISSQKDNKTESVNEGSVVTKKEFNKAAGITAHSPGRVDIHEHDHKEKSRHYHKAKHNHGHKSTGRHIHRHEHHHNHKHNHQHDHDGDHQQSHKHQYNAHHKHLHRKELLLNNKGWKRYNDEEEGEKPDRENNLNIIKGSSEESSPQGVVTKTMNSPTKDYHIKSVENYIGDSGKEFEGAAEQIVESYMGEYMQVIIIIDGH